MLYAIIKAARPHQWLKNLFFVGAPLMFARRLSDPEAVLRTGGAIAAFSLLASSVYLLNDIVDVQKDRAHPTKRRRPIASGALPLPTARVAAALFALTGLGLGTTLGLGAGAICLGYILLNVAYSLVLKRIAFVDVACIATGFLLRVLEGALAIDVPPSTWLLACTALLSAFLGFGKRAHELRVAGAGGATQRDALTGYSATSLRWLMGLLGVLTSGSYAAYTQSNHAIQFFGTRNLIFTLPFVAIGIGRFLRIVNRQGDAESPTDSMLRDKLLMGNLVAYVVTVFAIIYAGVRP